MNQESVSLWTPKTCLIFSVGVYTKPVGVDLGGYSKTENSLTRRLPRNLMHNCEPVTFVSNLFLTGET